MQHVSVMSEHFLGRTSPKDKFPAQGHSGNAES